MRKLSDYKGEDAVELWADLMEPLGSILTNEKVRQTVKSGGAPIMIAKAIMRDCKGPALQLLTRIDDSPVDGANILFRLISIVKEIEENEDFAAFFGVAQSSEEMPPTSIGDAKESTAGKKG